MHFTSLFASTLLLAGSAFAQTTGETVHVVQVGEGGNLTFSPSNVQAAVGDLVQFQFWPKNHSVVQSTFAQPCVPIQNVMSNATSAFYSGYMPTNRTASGAGSNTLTYTIRVTSTAPIWYYCSQAKHCQAGMVGAINAATTGEKTVAAFAGLAAQAAENLNPGQVSGSTTGSTNSTNTGNNNGGGATLSTSTVGSAATGVSTGGTTQQTTNAAPGQLLDSAKSGMAGIIAAAIAFFFL